MNETLYCFEIYDFIYVQITCKNIEQNHNFLSEASDKNIVRFPQTVKLKKTQCILNFLQGVPMTE